MTQQDFNNKLMLWNITVIDSLIAKCLFHWLYNTNIAPASIVLHLSSLIRGVHQFSASASTYVVDIRIANLLE